MKRRVKAYPKQYAKGDLEAKEVRQRLVSWLNHAKHGHTYHLRKAIMEKAVFQKDSEFIRTKSKEHEEENK